MDFSPADLIAQGASSKGQAWLGGKDFSGVGNDYRWNDMLPMNYTNCYPNKPNPQPWCITIFVYAAYPGQWNSVSCDYLFDGLCKSTPSVCFQEPKFYYFKGLPAQY